MASTITRDPFSSGETPVPSAKLNAIANKAADDIEALQDNFVQFFYASAYGVVGNGSTDDTVAVKALVTAAGTGGVIHFQPGTTILLSDEIKFLPKQRIYFNGAIFKRAAQISTTLASGSVVAGTTTTATLTSATGFNVGDYVSFTDKNINTAAGTAAYAHYTRRVPILTKTGNVITFSAPTLGSSSCSDLDAQINAGTADSSYTFNAGAVVSRVHHLVNIPSNCMVDGLEIDGNWKDSGGTILQPGGTFWDVFAEVLVSDPAGTTENIELINPTIYNFASEAILEAGGAGKATAVYPGAYYNIRYISPRIYNGAGNGIHLSAINNPLIYFPDIENVNQDLSVGHISSGGGAIALSFSGQHLSVQGGYLRKCWTGIGKISCYDHSSIKFNNVFVEDTYLRGIDAYTGMDEGTAGSPVDIQVSGCTLKNTGINAFGSSDVRPLNASILDVLISFNTLIGSTIRCNYAQDPMIANNLIRNEYVVPSTVALARTYTDTTAVVASATNYYKGQRVYFAKNGQRSRILAIASVSGTTLTFESPIGITSADNIPAGSFLYDADRMPVVQATGFTCAATDYTLTLPDVTMFRVNDYLMTSEIATLGVVTAAVRIKAVNYATGVLTLVAQIGQAYASKTVYFFRAFSPDFYANIQIDNCPAQVIGNKTRGGFAGVQSSGATTGHLVQGNKFLDVRGYGMQTSQSASAVEKYSGNIVTIASNAASWAQGFFAACKVEADDNSITTSASSHVGLYVNAGDHAVFTNTKIRGSGTASVSVTSGASNTHLADTFATGTITNSATGSPTTTGNVTIA